MTTWQPILATREALRIAGVRRLLTAAGIASDPRAVYPEDLERALEGAGNCLVIVDAQSLPQQDMLTRWLQASPGSRFVLWTDQPTSDVLQATLECGLHGLLSSQLPLKDAALALGRICRGERLLRFDPDPDPPMPFKPGRRVAEAPSFDAQWMLHGADSQGRET